MRKELFIIGLAAVATQFAFTRKQRQAIIERDQNKCQATVPHQHSPNKYSLEVDHVIPQRYAEKLGIDPDFPENALTKCRNAHDLKHKDRIQAREDWKTSHNGSFAHMSEKRNELLKHGEIYWDDSADRTDMTRAVQLTQKAEKKGWIFPPKRKR